MRSHLYLILRSIAVGAGLLFAVASFAPSVQAGGDLAPERPFSWTGLYFGGHVGYMWADIDAAFFGGGSSVTFPSLEADSAVAGIQVGIQRQWGKWVVGIEAGLTASLENLENSGFFVGNPNFRVAAGINDILTIGPRVGWSMGNWMPYFTGGYANASVSTRATTVATGATLWQHGERHGGWYLGGGIDWALSSNWTLGVEYRHYAFGHETYRPFAPSTTNQHRVDVDADIVSLRLSYKIGPGSK